MLGIMVMMMIMTEDYISKKRKQRRTKKRDILYFSEILHLLGKKSSLSLSSALLHDVVTLAYIYIVVVSTNGPANLSCAAITCF